MLELLWCDVLFVIVKQVTSNCVWMTQYLSYWVVLISSERSKRSAILCKLQPLLAPVRAHSAAGAPIVARPTSSSLCQLVATVCTTILTLCPDRCTWCLVRIVQRVFVVMERPFSVRSELKSLCTWCHKGLCAETVKVPKCDYFHMRSVCFIFSCWQLCGTHVSCVCQLLCLRFIFSVLNQP